MNQGARGGQREIAARADGAYAVVGIDHLTRAAQNQQRVSIRHNQHALQLANRGVAAPVLRQADGGTLQIASALGELFLKALAKRASTWPL